MWPDQQTHRVGLTQATAAAAAAACHLAAESHEIPRCGASAAHSPTIAGCPLNDRRIGTQGKELKKTFCNLPKRYDRSLGAFVLHGR